MCLSPTCAHIHCKKCGSENTIKAGWRVLAQKYKCKDCNHVFTKNDGRTKEERYKKRIVALFLHREKNISTSEIAEIFKVKENTIKIWIGKEAFKNDIDIENNEYYQRAWALYLKKNGLESEKNTSEKKEKKEKIDKRQKKHDPYKEKDIWQLAKEELENPDLMREDAKLIVNQMKNHEFPEWLKSKDFPEWLKKEMLELGLDEEDFREMNAEVHRKIENEKKISDIKLRKVKEKREKEKKNRRRGRR